MRECEKMNPKLIEINELIDLCDKMLEKSKIIGYIKCSDEDYRSYCSLIKSFCKKHNLINDNYAPYAILDKYWTTNINGTLYINEIEMIKNILFMFKHTLFKDDYEKIFISHREKDKEQVAELINLLHAIGIPRETVESSESMIFCTSHPEGYIKNGEKNLETIRNMINTDKHIFYILWYTDNYFQSQACLNEAGAIWAMKKKYQEILVPKFDNNKIIGLLDKLPVWFRADDKFRLNSFADDIQKMFSLPKVATNSWELARDKFIEDIDKLTCK